MVDSPRLPNAAPQGNPAASKASPAAPFPGRSSDGSPPFFPRKAVRAPSP